MEPLSRYMPLKPAEREEEAKDCRELSTAVIYM